MPIASPNAVTLYRRFLARTKLRHMHALLLLADLRSMARAAQAIGMSQPAMSQLVAEMEQLLETELFLRHSKGVDPTPVALELLPIARRMLAAAEEGAERVASRIGNDRGLVRLASTAAATGSLLDRTLPEFAGRNPAIQVQVSTVIGSGLDASFARDEFDMVCCRLRDVVPDGWTFVSCVPDDLVITAGATHPLAGRSGVSRDELGKASWLRNHVSTVARHTFDDLVAREGWADVQETQIVATVPVLIWSMLRTGEHLSLVPRSVVQPWLSEGLLAVVEADLTLPLPPIGFHWKPRHAGQATLRLAEHLSGRQMT